MVTPETRCVCEIAKSTALIALDRGLTTLLPSLQPLLINSIQSVWSLVVTFVFITFLVDRIGRRKPLIIGPIFMAGFLAWQAGIASQFTAGKGNSGLGIAGIASIFLFSGAFSMSYGPVSWIYQSEIFPMNLRAMGTSASTAANW